MLIIQALNNNKAGVFACFHARTDRELLAVPSLEAGCLVWSE